MLNKTYDTNDPEVLLYRDIIVDLIDPDKIILFGSYAYGTPTKDSDIDFCVVKEGEKHTYTDRAMLRVNVGKNQRKLGITSKCDPFLGSEKDLMEYAADTTSAAPDIINKGVIVYERCNTGRSYASS